MFIKKRERDKGLIVLQSLRADAGFEQKAATRGERIERRHHTGAAAAEVHLQVAFGPFVFFGQFGLNADLEKRGKLAAAAASPTVGPAVVIAIGRRLKIAAHQLYRVRQLIVVRRGVAARAQAVIARNDDQRYDEGSEDVHRIPETQKNLLKALSKTGKPIVLVLFTGRPLALTWEQNNVPAILNVWFGAWDFVGLDRIVTPIVGLVAIGGGLFFLYEWLYADGTCQVTDISKRAKISGQIRKLATEPFTWLPVGGVVALALSVNVIEFACSVGIPQAFTKIVEMNGLGFLETQGLMALYILFYMIDDVIVFGFALWGAGKLAQTGIYVKWCNLFGGLLMVALGALLLFKPEWLRF